MDRSISRVIRSCGIIAACLVAVVSRESVGCQAAFAPADLPSSARRVLSPSLAAPLPREGRSSPRIYFSVRAFGRKGNGDDGETDEAGTKDKGKKSEKLTLAEISRLEEESSREVMKRLTRPIRIGKAFSDTITFLGWGFVLSSILLKPLGYGYLKKDGGGLTITTLENRAFVLETRKVASELKPPTDLP